MASSCLVCGNPEDLDLSCATCQARFHKVCYVDFYRVSSKLDDESWQCRHCAALPLLNIRRCGIV